MLHENLLDTSHITFLHPGMIDGGNMAKASFNTSYKNGSSNNLSGYNGNPDGDDGAYVPFEACGQ